MSTNPAVEVLEKAHVLAEAMPYIREFSGKTVAAFRDALSSGVLTPLNLILLSRERLQ